jgi:hypothetical protein
MSDLLYEPSVTKVLSLVTKFNYKVWEIIASKIVNQSAT